MSWLLTVTEAMCLHTMLQQTLHTGTGYLTSTGVNFNSTHFNMQYNKYYTLLHWPKQHWFSNNISTTTLSVLWCWDKNVVHHCHLSKIIDIMKVWATALQQPLWQGVRASVLPDQGSQLHTHTIPDDTDKGSNFQLHNTRWYFKFRYSGSPLTAQNNTSMTILIGGSPDTVKCKTWKVLQFLTIFE